jgi:hypothetical protein
VVKYVERLRSDAGILDADRLVARFSGPGEGGHFGSACAAGNYADSCVELAFLFKALGLKME